MKRLNKESYLQIFFWSAAYLVLSIMIFLLMEAARSALPLSLPLTIVAGTFLGCLQGILFALAESLIYHHRESTNSLVRNILYRTCINFAVTVISLFVFKYLAYEKMVNFFIGKTKDILPVFFWKNVFFIIAAYNILLSLIAAFVTQVKKRFGPGMMMPILTGKYQLPQEEERIFVFMDLRSSTTLAEQLGHIVYSAFIRDCYHDLNKYIDRYKGEIYQYVGDEIVLTWKKKKGLKKNNYIRYVKDCQSEFRSRAAYYERIYQTSPFFKAAAHCGRVTVVEVGDLKREIAFHGDTINTAARIQSLCNLYNKSFLVSGPLAEETMSDGSFHVNPLLNVILKGRSRKIQIFSIE